MNNSWFNSNVSIKIEFCWSVKRTTLQNNLSNFPQDQKKTVTVVILSNHFVLKKMISQTLTIFNAL